MYTLLDCMDTKSKTSQDVYLSLLTDQVLIGNGFCLESPARPPSPPTNAIPFLSPVNGVGPTTPEPKPYVRKPLYTNLPLNVLNATLPDMRYRTTYIVANNNLVLIFLKKLIWDKTCVLYTTYGAAYFFRLS